MQGDTAAIKTFYRDDLTFHVQPSLAQAAADHFLKPTPPFMTIGGTRFTKGASDSCDVSVEPRIPAPVIQELEALGQKVATPPSLYSGNMGGGQASHELPVGFISRNRRGSI